MPLTLIILRGHGPTYHFPWHSHQPEFTLDTSLASFFSLEEPLLFLPTKLFSNASKPLNFTNLFSPFHIFFSC